MRVAVVGPFPPNPPGEGHYAGELVAALRRHDPSIEIAAFAQVEPGEPPETVRTDGVRVIRYWDPRTTWGRQASCWRLWRDLRRWRPDVVHFEGGLLPYFGGKFGEPLILLALLLRLAGVRMVATIHSTWLHEDLIELARNAGLPAPLQPILAAYYRLLMRALCANLNAVCILGTDGDSPIVQRYAREYRLRGGKTLLEPHPCAVRYTTAQNQQDARDTLKLAGKRLVLSVGFVRPDKGFDLLLGAAPQLLREFPDVVIAILGSPGKQKDQSYARQLEGQAQASGAPDRVRVQIRYIPDEEFSMYLDAADILVIPYLRSIGASGPIHHALGRGKAIVASNIGHNTALNGVCCLVPAQDSLALREAIGRLLREPQEADALAARAQQYAASHSWDQLGAATAELYRNLARRARPLSSRYFRPLQTN